jgi:hypothetical protein
MVNGLHITARNDWGEPRVIRAVKDGAGAKRDVLSNTSQSSIASLGRHARNFTTPDLLAELPLLKATLQRASSRRRR